MKSRISAGPSVTRITEGKIRKNTGKNQFDADFARLFLGDLAEADAQVAGVGFKRRAYAGAKAIGVDQKVGELAQLRVVAAGGKIPQARRRARRWLSVPDGVA